MKKLIFANCVLAIALIFSFCAKPDLKEELSGVKSGETASNRYECTLTHVGVENGAILTFCGTNTNATNCTSCTGSTGHGVETQSITGLNLTISAPAIISVRANKLTVVNFSTGGSPTGPIQIPTGGCKRFSIDANCNIAAL